MEEEIFHIEERKSVLSCNKGSKSHSQSTINCQDAHPLGIISLVKATVVPYAFNFSMSRSPHVSKDALSFVIRNGVRNWILRAPDGPEKESWMNAIQQAIM